MIDSKKQEELRAKYNPDGSDLRIFQLRLLEILKFLDKICVENDIKYWLSSGTLLGAVRHGGFIPWDDDVDIELERKDYKKLIKILSNTKHEQFELQTYRNDHFYIAPFAKLRDKKSIIKEGNKEFLRLNGCFVDIFPLERNNFFSLKATFLLHYGLLETLYPKWACKFIKYIYVYLKYVFIDILFPIIRFINYPLTKKGLLFHTYGVGFMKPRCVADIYPLNRIKFEGYEFNCPHSADGYLRKIYGNYMELPKNESAYRIHVVKANLW
jgi:lipopolysaccharide cholinephosphotransferase